MHRILLAALSLGAAVSPAFAGDQCDFFYLSNQAGPQWSAHLPSVTGGALVDPHANTSFRYNSSDVQANMSGMYEDVRSLRVRAIDSDVAVYVHSGHDFSMDTYVMHCEKGNVCEVDDLGSMNDRLKSFKCQREFGRKANDSALGNPIIDGEDIRTGFATKVATDMAASAAAAGTTYGARTTTLGWLGMSELCRVEGWYCANIWQPRYRDLMTIDHDFVLHPTLWFPYQASLGYDVEPRLDSGGDLEFWQARRSVWVESGLLQPTLESAVVTGLNGVDMPDELRDAVLLEAGGLICPTCSDDNKRIWGSAIVDNKDRYQFSYYNTPATGSYPTASQFNSSQWSYTTPPKLVLNADRDAQL